MACIDWVKWRKKHCSEFYGYVHTVYKIDITWTNDNDLMTWQWETLHYALYDIWYKKINRTLYIGWPGCGIDREEGRRGALSTMYEAYVTLWQWGVHISHSVTSSGNKVCWLLLNISKIRIVLELEQWKFTFYRVIEILMLWCSQSVSDSQSLLQVWQFYSSW